MFTGSGWFSEFFLTQRSAKPSYKWVQLIADPFSLALLPCQVHPQTQTVPRALGSGQGTVACERRTASELLWPGMSFPAGLFLLQPFTCLFPEEPLGWRSGSPSSLFLLLSCSMRSLRFCRQSLIVLPDQR